MPHFPSQFLLILPIPTLKTHIIHLISVYVGFDLQQIFFLCIMISHIFHKQYKFPFFSCVSLLKGTEFKII